MSVLARSLLFAPTALAGCMGLSPSVTLGLQRSFSAAPAVDTSSAKVPVMPPFSYKPAPYKGPSAEEVMRLRKAHLSPCECLSHADLPPASKGLANSSDEAAVSRLQRCSCTSRSPL